MVSFSNKILKASNDWGSCVADFHHQSSGHQSPAALAAISLAAAYACLHSLTILSSP